MDGKILLRSLSLKNILSFGPEGVDIGLEPLNVLVGPNGSGKSNFLEAIRLLQHAPRDIAQPIRENGGLTEWLWKGDSKDKLPIRVEVDVEEEKSLLYDYDFNEHIMHLFFLSPHNGRLHFVGESITSSGFGGEYHVYNQGNPLENEKSYISVRETINFSKSMKPAKVRKKRELDSGTLDTTLSILAQRNDFDFYYDINTLSTRYSRIALYTNFNFGRLTAARLPQSADLESAFLSEDYSNLALVLNDLQNRPGVIDTIIEKLKRFNDRIEGINTRVNFGMVELRIREKGLAHTIPATRLSDGTLRFLCLLVILCHPNPPPLICIEEPELGMHPDILPTIAELLIEASQRTQIIITTHSDILVSNLQSVPEALVICERGENGTTMRRLTAAEIVGWPAEVSLGDIWLKGAIGGVRW